MSSLLKSAAVSSKSGKEAAEIFSAYLETAPAMVFAHTLAAAQRTRPTGTGAGDDKIRPGG